MKRQLLRRYFKIILVISTILVIAGILAKWFLGPIAIQKIVYKNMEIKEGTMAYDTWVSEKEISESKHILISAFELKFQKLF